MSGTPAVVVATILTTELPIGVTVPNEDGKLEPLTRVANWVKAEAVINWRGDRVWKMELSDETSTWR